MDVKDPLATLLEKRSTCHGKRENWKVAMSVGEEWLIAGIDGSECFK